MFYTSNHDIPNNFNPTNMMAGMSINPSFLTLDSLSTLNAIANKSQMPSNYSISHAWHVLTFTTVSEYTHILFLAMLQR